MKRKSKNSIIGKPGVYALTIDGIVRYVGSTGSDLESRKSNHLANLRNNKHKNIALQESFNKSGESSYQFVVLDFCPKSLTLKLEDYHKMIHRETIFNQNGINNTVKKLRRGRGAAQIKKKLSELNSGEGNPMARLSRDQAGEVLWLREYTSMNSIEIAERYKISVSHVNRIGKRRWIGINPVRIDLENII